MKKNRKYFIISLIFLFLAGICFVLSIFIKNESLPNDIIIKAASKYVLDNKEIFNKIENNKSYKTITIKNLIDNKYLNKNEYKDKNECNYVYVTKENNKYDYKYKKDNEHCIEQSYIHNDNGPSLEIIKYEPTGENYWYTKALSVIIKAKASKNNSIVAVFECSDKNCNNSKQLVLSNNAVLLKYDEDTEGKEIFYKAIDSNNNVIIDSIKYKKDGKLPNCTMSVVGDKKDGFYNKNVEIKLYDYSDLGPSKTSTYGLSKNGKKYNKKNKIIIKENIEKVIYEGYVKDNAGNENICSSGYISVDSSKFTY